MSYTISDVPFSLAVGDLDSDGKPEIIVNNQNSISILKNKIGAITPLHLLSFIGKAFDNKVQLKWQTAQEQNTHKFEIERSTNLRNYLTIGSKNATGNSTSTTDYSYTDNSPLKGTNFYRLKMFDSDGSLTFSKVVAISINNATKRLTVYPNPTSDLIQLQAFGENERATLQITNVSGKIVKQEVVSLNGFTALSIDIKPLQAGKYFVTLQRTSAKETAEFIKL